MIGVALGRQLQNQPTMEPVGRDGAVLGVDPLSLLARAICRVGGVNKCEVVDALGRHRRLGSELVRDEVCGCE